MANEYAWTSPDGTVINLSDRAAGYIVTDGGTTGLRSPSYSLTTSQYAGIDGAEVQAIRAEPAEPTIGLHMSADSFPAFRAKLRGLVRAMRPKAGVGTLTVSNESGESRSLNCYCIGGLEGDEASRYGPWFKAILKLYAPSPWWYGEEQTIDFGLAAPSIFLSATEPFPRRLSASTIQGQQDVDLSDADDNSFPVWTVTGPGTGLVLTNNTTGRVIQANVTLGDGQTLVIDTRPGHQAVYRGDLPATDPARNKLWAVSSDPALWPLVEGVNDVTAVLGAAGENSRIRGVYTPRYAGI